jgi:outer membrane protein assembly factor BamD (BamD/ComL family)
MKKRIFLLLTLSLIFLAGCSGELSSDELFQNAKTAYNSGNYQKAVTDLQTFMKKFPDDPEYPQVLFLYAFINANQLNNFEEAEKAYKKFLKKYPEHEMAASAKFELDNLGKPVDELILKMNDKNVKN